MGRTSPPGVKLALVILTELSSLLYSGTVFGWAPMLLVLRGEGLFVELCDGSEKEEWCDAQKERLGLIFTVAAVIYSASGFFVGAFIDRFGPSSCILLATVLSLAGFYFFGLYTSSYMVAGAPSWTPIVGYSLIAVGSMSFFQAAFKVQYAFPEPSEEGQELTYRAQTLIIAGVTTLGDASVCMWLLFEALYSRYEVSLASIFIGYSIFTLFISGALFILWIVCGPEILQEPDSDSSDGVSYGAVPSEEKSGIVMIDMSRKGTSELDVAPTGEGSESYLLLSHKDFWSQVFSLEFLFVMTFAVVHVTRGNFFLGHLEFFFESVQFNASEEEVRPHPSPITHHTHVTHPPIESNPASRPSPVARSPCSLSSPAFHAAAGEALCEFDERACSSRLPLRSPCGCDHRSLGLRSHGPFHRPHGGHLLRAYAQLIIEIASSHSSSISHL